MIPARQARPRRTWRSKASSRPSVEQEPERDVERDDERDGRREGAVELLLRRRACAPSRSRSAAASSARPAPSAAAETEANARPGGVISAFCEPETTTSMPQSSVSSGTAPRLETASTTTSAPASFAAAASAWTSATTPVEVSEWARKTSETGSISPSWRARSSARRRLAPRVAELLDLAAERARHRRPALAEVPGRDDEHALAGRAEVGDRRLERAGARAREEEHVALGAVHLLQPLEHARVDLAEVRRAVVDDRLGERGEHLRRHGRRPGREQVPLLRHRPQPSAAPGRRLCVSETQGSSRPAQPSRSEAPNAACVSETQCHYAPGVEALLAFAAALLTLRLAGCSPRRWRARRQPHLLAWSAGLARLRARGRRDRAGARGRLERRELPRLLPLRRPARPRRSSAPGSLLRRRRPRGRADRARLHRARGRGRARRAARGADRRHVDPGGAGAPRALPGPDARDRRQRRRLARADRGRRPRASGVARSATRSCSPASRSPPSAARSPGSARPRRPPSSPSGAGLLYAGTVVRSANKYLPFANKTIASLRPQQRAVRAPAAFPRPASAVVSPSKEIYVRNLFVRLLVLAGALSIALGAVAQTDAPAPRRPRRASGAAGGRSPSTAPRRGAGSP